MKKLFRIIIVLILFYVFFCFENLSKNNSCYGKPDPIQNGRVGILVKNTFIKISPTQSSLEFYNFPAGTKILVQEENENYYFIYSLVCSNNHGLWGWVGKSNIELK